MDIIIANSSDDPIYQQITAQIKNLIFKGELIEGDSLPSIRNLARELQISVITTKKAYEVLEAEGYIETVPGKGSYIAAQNKNLLQEKRLKIVEEKFIEGIIAARAVGFNLEEIEAMIKMLYQEVANE
ncbi:MAG: GntR family transcriptional regulator [Halanaerobiales bacterium]|nr:GntR family transcriptional regulator [Halanaerobiales bacterium]